LEHLVKDDYEIIQKNIIYPKNNKRVIGEIDLLCIKQNSFDLYEVKSCFRKDTVSKAVKQLERARNYFQLNGDSFLYTPKYGIMEIELVKDYLKLPRKKQKKMLEKLR